MPQMLSELNPHGIEVLVVDGHEPSRLGLGVLLEREPWISRCLLARSSSEAVELAQRHRPPIAILDVSDAWAFVGTATNALRDAHAGIQIVLSSRCAVPLPASPRELGASAYIHPRSTADEVVEAVRLALVSPETSASVAPDPDDGQLTPRQRELLMLISTGATNKEIAERLHLGPDAVKKNASALYRKLGVRNRAQAARFASSLDGQRLPSPSARSTGT